MNCSITGMSEARLWQGSGRVANKGRPKNPKRSQKGQFLFTGLSWIKTYVRENVIFKVQELRCCFFLLPHPYSLKKKLLGKNKPETPDSRSSYTSCQSRKHRATRFWQDFLDPVLLNCLLWISFPLFLPQSYSATAPLHGFLPSTQPCLLSLAFIPVDLLLPNQTLKKKN